MKRNKCLFYCLLTACVLMGLSASTYAQAFGGLTFKKRNNSKQSPTVITSDTMNIDLGKNEAVFTGNVVVDDDEMTINCHKMTIYLVDAKKKKGDEKDEKKSDMEAKAGNKEITKIVCTGDVVITRKIADPEEEKQGKQRAVAGKAVYDLKKETITLLEKPVIYRGKDKVTGSELVLHTDSDMMEGKNVKIETTPQGENKKDK